jgi:glycosyltransferase 2 family protein
VTKLRTVIIALLAIALLAWFLHDISFREVWTLVRGARKDYIALSFVFLALTYLTRTIRWQHLLQPLGHASFRNTLNATLIGFAALSVLPARAGDLVRPYILAKREGLDPSATFATVIMERVLDGIAVLVLLAIFVWGIADSSALPGQWRGVMETTAAIGGVVAAGLLVLMWILASHPERIGKIVFTMSRFLPHGVATRLSELATAFSGGFAAATQPRPLAMGIAWSFPLWLAISAETWAVTRAFGIEMPFTGGFLLMAWLVLGVAVPTPGFVGGYHAAYRFAVTTFFMAPEERAVAAALVVHAVTFIPVVLLGVLVMIHDGLSVGRLKDLAGKARAEEIPPHRTS